MRSFDVEQFDSTSNQGWFAIKPITATNGAGAATAWWTQQQTEAEREWRLGRDAYQQQPQPYIYQPQPLYNNPQYNYPIGYTNPLGFNYGYGYGGWGWGGRWRRVQRR